MPRGAENSSIDIADAGTVFFVSRGVILLTGGRTVTYSWSPIFLYVFKTPVFLIGVVDVIVINNIILAHQILSQG
jgi:hypothetical protein